MLTLPTDSSLESDTENLPSHQILICSSLSKACASITTYPHEVVRTRLQIQRGSQKGASSGFGKQPRTVMGIMDIIRLIARTDGLRGFYRGLAVNLTRTVPSSAMTILTWVNDPQPRENPSLVD